LASKVPKEKGEAVRKILLERGLLDISLKVKKTDRFILFPVLSEDARTISRELVEDEFEERELTETDYRSLAQVPEGLKELLPTSFDVIGDVGIVKLPEALLPYARQVGEALRKVAPRLRTVALDKGVKGELRIRDLEVIAGDPSTETTHLEYGIKFLIDPAKVYFNPRLAHERRRIASLVRQGEVVVDMFAGVGPFSIMIARYALPSLVVAVDLNPDAVDYLKRNIELNKANRVVPYEGDARQVVFDVPCADRIIMNLPHSAIDFFHDALTRLKLQGTIHFYHICERDEAERIVADLISDAKGMGVKLKAKRIEELKTYSPSMSVFSVDFVLDDWC
jgi:tRNA (guanine37-N1)-methyltransferase